MLAYAATALQAIGQARPFGAEIRWNGEFIRVKTIQMTRTGMDTEIGRIAAMLQSVEAEPTPLQQRCCQM